MVVRKASRRSSKTLRSSAGPVNSVPSASVAEASISSLLRLRAPPAERIEILERITHWEEVRMARSAGRIRQRPELRAQQHALLERRNARDRMRRSYAEEVQPNPFRSCGRRSGGRIHGRVPRQY